VTPAQADLTVVVTRTRDVVAAQAGGADRLLLTASPTEGHVGPEPALVSAVTRESDLPVLVVLRHDELPFHRLALLGQTYVELGASGLVFGFLDRDLEVDVEPTVELAHDLGVPWWFRGVDDTLAQDRSWRRLRAMPHLAGVPTAGSTRGLAHGVDEVCARLESDIGWSDLVVAAGGLTPEVVPWLARSGVRRFAVGSAARAGSSWARGDVDVERVRTWRMLVDDAVDRAIGVPL